MDTPIPHPPAPSRRTLALRILPAILAAAIPPGAAGCAAKSRAPARRLLEAITKSNKRLVSASRGLSETVIARLEDKSSNDELREATEGVLQAIDKLRDESLEWIVPSSPEAESLVVTYRSNLERRRAIVEEYGAKILDVLANSVVPGPEKKKKARALYEQMLKKGDVEVAAMRDAQRRYAGSMGIFAYE